MWIARHVAFGGTDPANLEKAKQAIATRLTILSPEDDERLLRDAGVPRASLFVYVGGITEWKSNGLPVETGARRSGQLLQPRAP